MLKIGNPKRWIAVGALTLAMCAISVAQPEKYHKFRGGPEVEDWDYCRTTRCQQVPEGGSTAGYLLTVGAVCLGALLVRSRRQRSLTA
jgi:hypothetical protein